METFKDIAVILGCITSTITVITLVMAAIPKFRKKVADWIRGKSGSSNIEKDIAQVKYMLEKHMADDMSKKEGIALQKEAMKCMLRDTITHIYYKRVNSGEIPVYEMEDLVHLYESYKALGGNSYVKNLYDQMTKEWTITR